MADPSGHTLLSQALRVINQAIDAHRDTPPWRDIVAKTSGAHAPARLGVEVYEGDPPRVVDRYAIHAHEGRFELVEQGRGEAEIHWRVSVDDLRHIVAKPDRYLADPSRLPLAWLEARLGIGAKPKRATSWRPGSTRRPK